MAPVLWVLAYAVSWLGLVWIWADAAPAVGVIVVLSLWGCAVMREVALAHRLRTAIASCSPEVLAEYRVGTLNASWNHARLLKASGDFRVAECTEAGVLSGQVRVWRLSLVVGFWLGPAVAVGLYLAIR